MVGQRGGTVGSRLSEAGLRGERHRRYVRSGAGSLPRPVGGAPASPPAERTVLDADEEAGRFSVHGSDELPSEYVLTKGADAAVELPTCFEPRIENPEAEIEDPERAESEPEAGFHLPGSGAGWGSRNADCTNLDDTWTEEAADRTLRWLAEHGWRVECLLAGTERDGWYEKRWGRCALYLARRDAADGPADDRGRARACDARRGTRVLAGRRQAGGDAMATVGTAFVLHLDRAGLGTATPATEVVGTADTIEHLYWLARGAAHFERGGRLWAENADTGECLTLGDLRIEQRCEGCGRGVEDCDRERPPRAEGATECDGRRRRRELAERGSQPGDRTSGGAAATGGGHKGLRRQAACRAGDKPGRRRRTRGRGVRERRAAIAGMAGVALRNRPGRERR